MTTDQPAPATTPNAALRSRRFFLRLIGIGTATMATASCAVDLRTVRWEHVPTPTALTPDADELLREGLRQYCENLHQSIVGAPAQGANTPPLAQLADQVTAHLNALGPRYISGLPEPTAATSPTATSPTPTTQAPTAPGDPKTIANLLPTSGQVINPQLTAASADMAVIAGLIQATYLAWAHWLTKTNPEPLTAPPELTQKPDESCLKALTSALQNRYATVYHYGALAQNQPKPVTSALARQLARHDGTSAILQEAARRAQLTPPAPHAAYTALPQAPLDQNAQKLERACGHATARLLKSCPAGWRTWVIHLATTDAHAATAWGQVPQNLLP